jgi:hypothetical protein
MIKYALHRLTKFLFTIGLMVVITFFFAQPWLEDGLHSDWGSKASYLNYIRVYKLDQPVMQRFFSYMFVDVEEGQRTELGWLDLGVFGVYQIGPEDGSRLECGAICVNFGPSFRQRGKNVEDILFGSVP